MSQPIELPRTSLWANRKCLAICCAVSMASLQFGIDSGVIGSLQAMPGFLVVFGYPNRFIPGGYGIESKFQQLITSLLTLGTFVSSLAAGVLSHRFGRKTALWIACAFTAVGIAIQMGTEDKGVIYFGRIVLGIGNGFLVTFSNIYCAEVAPAHLRAVMVGLSTEWILVGSIIAAAVTNATQSRLDKPSYLIPMGMSLILPVVLTVALLYVPESPRYLITKGRREAARKSLETLRGDSLQPEELELEFMEMINGIEEDKKMAETVGFIDIFKGTNLRRTLLSIGVTAADVGSGAQFLIAYVTYFMVISGVTVAEAFRYFVINTCIGLVAVNFGLFAMRHLCGRRTFLMIGAILDSLFMLALAISGTVATDPETAKNCLIAFVSLFLINYSIFIGVATRPVATELVSSRLRAWSFGVTQAFGSILAWLTTFCTPYFINPENLNWGVKYGYIWAGSSLLCLIWYYFFVPELKGRALEEIDEIFRNKVSAWEFKNFKTTILDDALKDVQRGSSYSKTAGVAVEQKVETSRE